MGDEFQLELADSVTRYFRECVSDCKGMLPGLHGACRPQGASDGSSGRRIVLSINRAFS